MPQSPIINVISESNFTVKEQGVHSASMQCVSSLKKQGQNVLINSFQHYDIAHIHNIGPLSVYFLLKKKKPRVISAHVTADSFIGSIVGAKLWFVVMQRYLIWLYNQADLVLAVSTSTFNTLQGYSLSSKLIQHSNTIDSSDYNMGPIDKDDLKTHLSLPKDKLIIICCGQVQAHKGVDDFISVAKSLPQYHFVWVGGVLFSALSDKSRVMKNIMKKKYSNTTFTDTIAPEMVKQYYFASDIFWLPSYQETFGLVVIGAAAAGLPILLRNIDDYNERFRAYAMMAGDNAAFAESIKSLLKDSLVYCKYKELAHKLVLKYDSNESTIKLLTCYRELIIKYEKK